MNRLRQLWHTAFGHPKLICSCGNVGAYVRRTNRSWFRNILGNMQGPSPDEIFMWSPVEPGSTNDPFSILHKVDPESLVLKVDYYLHEGKYDIARQVMPSLFTAVHTLLREAEERDADYAPHGFLGERRWK